jgi:hypothetical protein
MNTHILNLSFIENFNNLSLNNKAHNNLMLKMRSVDETYGGMFEELYTVLEEIKLLYEFDDLFNNLKLDEIVYSMIDYYSDDYLKYINSFIQFMKENISNNMKISDVLYCIKNY